MITRDEIVAEARSWLGTPYVHQASAKGLGTDCLGLVRGVYRALLQGEPERPPAYSADWAEFGGRELLRDAARRHLVPIEPGGAIMGDVILFRMRMNGPAKHAAILTAPGRMIHAYAGHAVMETALSHWWRRRVAFAFAFPEVSE
ncbi:MAG: C40 family peptidase [Alphaproteobacteria bacterium]|nr:C40 family peptidase [Alphaproteobacteria bacterium]